MANKKILEINTPVLAEVRAVRWIAQGVGRVLGLSDAYYQVKMEYPASIYYRNGMRIVDPMTREVRIFARPKEVNELSEDEYERMATAAMKAVLVGFDLTKPSGVSLAIRALCPVQVRAVSAPRIMYRG